MNCSECFQSVVCNCEETVNTPMWVWIISGLIIVSSFIFAYFIVPKWRECF